MRALVVLVPSLGKGGWRIKERQTDGASERAAATKVAYCVIQVC